MVQTLDTCCMSDTMGLQVWILASFNALWTHLVTTLPSNEMPAAPL